jgi:protein TonB
VLRAPQDAPILPIVTLVLWSLCFLVGLLGLLLHYPALNIAAPTTPSIQTQLVNVQLDKRPTLPPPQEMPPPKIGNPSLDIATPAAPPSISIPEIPAIAVASPSPSISFAVPVESLTTLVDANQAAHSGAFLRTAAPQNSSGAPGQGGVPGGIGSGTAAPTVTRLTFGKGEGNQPAPEYPREAALAGQEGTVTVRFTVDAGGHVTSTTVSQPSHWPLLNHAATTAVKETWHFAPGLPRAYEVPIEFQLNR